MSFRKNLLAGIMWFAVSGFAHAQTSPKYVFGQTLSSAGLNHAFPGKQDYRGTSGSGALARVTSPAFTMPDLGTRSAIDLANGVGLPLTSGVSGALAVANSGAGQTSASATINALLPPKSGGTATQVLTSNSSAASWSSADTGTVTSVNVSGSTTGLTFSGGPVTRSGTIMGMPILSSLTNGVLRTDGSGNVYARASNYHAGAEAGLSPSFQRCHIRVCSTRQWIGVGASVVQ